MTKYTAPDFDKDAFDCPHCGAFAHMKWRSKRRNIYYQATCAHCRQYSLWRVTKMDSGGFNIAKGGEMLYPDFSSTPLPSKDMPEDVKGDYEEATRISVKPLRGAAALLRLGLQKLHVHLGEEGRNINTDIRSLVNKGVFSGRVVQITDTLRVTGNNVVHPSRISDADFDKATAKMFDLVSFVVKRAITEPKELDKLCQLMSGNAKNTAEAQDRKALESKT